MNGRDISRAGPLFPSSPHRSSISAISEHGRFKTSSTYTQFLCTRKGKETGKYSMADEYATPATAGSKRLPRVSIEFCTQCKWLLRAAYVSPFLFSFFLFLYASFAPCRFVSFPFLFFFLSLLYCFFLLFPSDNVPRFPKNRHSCSQATETGITMTRHAKRTHGGGCFILNLFHSFANLEMPHL